ncbi:spore-associated protein A [Nonomuraea sp. NPDC059194]|uniref:spore-associated protein A n=1 Tax=Nonomuraea sp. NPDC059194 TaxID=3346764 RepID=UPI0036BCEC1C
MRTLSRVLAPAALAALLLHAAPAGADPVPADPVPADAAPADDAVAAATPESVCGAGYRIIDSLPISTPRLWATVYLLYNSGNGYNCVVTWKKTNLSVRTYTEARIQVKGSSTIHRNGGDFYTYAGPVRVKAPGKCVQFGGVASDAPGGQRFQSLSPWGHCG